MIPPSLLINTNSNNIPLFLFTLIILLLLFSPFSLSKSSSQFNPQPQPQLTMPGKRNLSISSPPPPMGIAMAPRNKKLRRLPHVFSKVLELPYDSDADVAIEDRPDCLRFVAKEGNRVVLGLDVRAQVVEVHPGVTKVVIRRRENDRSQPSIDELDLNVWRFRLPAAARPELAKAVYCGGQLVVTVPKNGWGENINPGDDCKGGFRGNMGTLVLVQ